MRGSEARHSAGRWAVLAGLLWGCSGEAVVGGDAAANPPDAGDGAADEASLDASPDPGDQGGAMDQAPTGDLAGDALADVVGDRGDVVADRPDAATAMLDVVVLADATIDRPDAADVADVRSTADAAADVQPDVRPDVGMDVAADVQPDVRPDVAADLPADVRPDVGMDAVADVQPDVRPDVVMDVQPDVGLDVVPDVVVDRPRPDVVRDVMFPPVEPDPVTFTGSFAARTGSFTARLTVAGIARDMSIFVPRSNPTGAPLLLLFHGTNGSGPGIMTELAAASWAERNGVIVVAPSSRYIDHGDWDHPAGAETYWETYPSTDPNTNPDLLLVRSIIVAAIRAYSVDEDRVYALGHSSGGFFTLLVASTLNDRIAAFLENSAGLNQCATTPTCRFQGRGTTCDALRVLPRWCSCTGADKPVSPPTTGRFPAAYLVHGTSDPLVSVYYTCQLEERLQGLGYVTETFLRDGDGHDIPATTLNDRGPWLLSQTRM